MPSKKTEVIPTVQMPSADLINFRFDQTDKGMSELKDMISALAGTFVTKEEFQDVNRRLDSYTWYWRTIFTSILLLVGGVIAALIERR